MPGVPATILGGLPVWAEVSFTRGDGWTTDDDAEVDELYWLKRDGTKGSPISQKVWDRLDKIEYWQCDVIDNVTDHLMYRCEECKGTGIAETIEGYDRPCDVCKGSGVPPEEKMMVLDGP